MKIFKNKKIISLILITLLLCGILSGCSSDYDANSTITENFAGSYSDDFNSGDLVVDKNTTNESFDTENTKGDTVASNRKIIETQDITVETKQFDKTVSSLKNKINDIGGYIETSSLNNNDSYRSANFTIRIPQETTAQFNTFIDENTNVTYHKTDTKDVTLEYVDIESRIEAHNIEKEKLEELLKKATNLNDVLTIQNKLTDIIYEIESYESQLRVYNNLIDYTTINIDIIEVEVETVTEELTVWQTIGKNLQDGFRNVGDFLVEVFILAISSVPYLLLLVIPALILLVIIFICLKVSKRKNKKTVQKPEQSKPNTSSTK